MRSYFCACMSQKVKYIALLLVSVFVFRMFFTNGILITSLHAEQAQLVTIKTSEKIFQTMKSEIMPYHMEDQPSQAEVAEEDDPNQILVKDPKSSSLFIAIFHCFHTLATHPDQHNWTELRCVKQSYRTYLSISVLRL
jgi:hypothetical protein